VHEKENQRERARESPGDGERERERARETHTDPAPISEDSRNAIIQKKAISLTNEKNITDT